MVFLIGLFVYILSFSLLDSWAGRLVAYIGILLMTAVLFMLMVEYYGQKNHDAWVAKQRTQAQEVEE